MKSIKCGNCQKKVSLLKIPEYHFDTVGLPNIWLIDILGYKCAACGNNSVIFPNYGQLMTTITRAIVFKDESFSSQELRFLKKFFDLKGKEIAKKLGTSEKTFSFWISGKTKMSPAYGIKIRQLFSNLFLEYVQKNHEKIKTFIKVATEIKKIADGSVTESEVIRRLKERAKFASKKKISEAQTFAESSSEGLIFRIPDSSSSVAIRY